MDVYRDTERIMAAKKSGGPPDLKKPFTRGGRTGVKKQPDPEPNEEYNEDNQEQYPEDVEVQEFQEDPDDLPDPESYIPPPPPQQSMYPPQQYPPRQQYPPQYQQAMPPPPPQPQPTPAQEPPDPYTMQLYQFNANNQALGIHVQNIQKLLEIQKKYMIYQRAIIEAFEQILVKQKRAASAAPAPQPVYTPPPIGSKPGLAAQPITNGSSPEDERKSRMKTAVFLGIGVMLLGGSVYLGTEGKLATFNIIAYVLAGIGGGLITKIIK